MKRPAEEWSHVIKRNPRSMARSRKKHAVPAVPIALQGAESG